ncbi:MAG: alpha/beta fold hydrolase [Anaerolineaceae bacterium]|nr:alpha/beta fold hydrolase [Anaerolineaceae bacterium]
MEVDLELYREEILVREDPPVRLSYIEVTPEHPVGTMVFVHGYGGYAMQWKYQLKAFSANYRVIAYDVRGHGASDAPYSAYTMAEAQEDLDTLIEKLHVEKPFVLVGHSFGGAIVTQYAFRRPEMLSHLVLIATTGEYSLFPGGERLLSLPLVVLRPIRNMIRKQLAAEAHVLKRFYFKNMKVWNGWTLFPDLSMPVLVIRGERDQVYPTAAFEEVARAIPGAEDVNIGVSRHLVPLERADAVNRAITRFVSEGQAEPSWRGKRSKADPLAERPWLRHYEQGVPATLGFPNRPLYYLLNSANRRHRSRPAVVFGGRTLTYGQLNAEVNRMANALRSLGVEMGTRVMLLLPNTPQFIIAYYAILKAGGVVVSTSPVNEQGELQRQVTDSQADLLITLTLFSQTARHLLATTALRGVIFTNIKDYLGPLQKLAFTMQREQKEGHFLSGGIQKKEYLWTQLCQSHPTTSPKVNVRPDSIAVIKYTGGTTDKPKGVILSHRALLANTLQTRHWITQLREGREAVLAVVPFSHSYGMTTSMNVPIALGAKIIPLPSFITLDVLQAIKRHKPTLFPGVPTMYMAINQFPRVRRYGISSIRACISGAAPLPVEVQEAFEKLTKGRLVEGYGLTEAGPVTHANPVNGLRKVGSIGIPLPSTEAAILDLMSGEPVEVGQIGELVVRGPQVMEGYWGEAVDEEEEAPITEDGWLHTGDIARMDEDGYFQIISRKKDMILAGKFQVYPRDVEEVLYEHPGVKEVAVVGLSQGSGDRDKVKAYVVPRPGTNLSADELIALCKRRLQEYAVPWEIEFRAELPKSFVGKVLRRLLVEEQRETKPETDEE